MTLGLAVLLGLVVGLANGGLGAGASVLAIPALMYPLAQSPRAAATASLVSVGVASLAGLGAHARGGRVRWVPGLVFGGLGVAGSVAGSRLSRVADPRILLLCFAALLLVVAALIIRSRDRDDAAGHGDGSAAAHHSPRSLVGVGVSACGVGVLTGLLGVGGGFVVVPALTLLLGFRLPEAIGTSLLVISINCAVALLARGAAPIHLEVVVPFTLGTGAGTVAGSLASGRLPVRRLRQAFALLLAGVGVWVGAEAVRGLVG